MMTLQELKQDSDPHLTRWFQLVNTGDNSLCFSLKGLYLPRYNPYGIHVESMESMLAEHTYFDCIQILNTGSHTRIILLSQYLNFEQNIFNILIGQYFKSMILQDKIL
ncbi:uncharacterized protein LACBIDRAFT_307104 [Laccaria bicolor S238N-H82]|uniref:Predicted protein n=1 Tax=Laccaria bicolor (strain S238N-H82 / ATCC MYA-4686) TaxID=486041 RepID=B0DPE5_LACBS|nr:uncharacterized protein LACBIDRAFT_307104 [Laccaria bicolor S238N-H82]EDR03668.1 predicted protein [Laccaria bicolor S238N-H82]|eukprot:XP_001885816.1 predicted protein [Laccaria bicolor S238N-H82]